MRDLQLLYTEDPLNLTREDIGALVEDLRKKKRAFDQTGAPTRAAASKKATDPLPDLDISL